MNGGVSKLRARRSRVKLSKALQDKLLDAVADTGAGMHGFRRGRHVNSSGTGLPPSYGKLSPASGELARDTVPVQSTKRDLDATSEVDPLPAKRARLTRTDAQQAGVEDEEEEQAAKV